jgi:hypothetical protein
MGVGIVCRYHLHTILDGVKPVESPKRLRAVFVRESSWIARFLADVFYLIRMPCGVACEQDVTSGGVQQNADAAWGVTCEIDKDNRTVVEDIVAARKGQYRGTVEVVVDGRATL